MQISFATSLKVLNNAIWSMLYTKFWLFNSFIKFLLSKIFPSLSEFSPRLQETDYCERDIVELFLLNEQIIWFDFSPSVVLYNAKKVSNSNMHIESKNQNTKRTIKTKNKHFFIFVLKSPGTLILWRRLVLWLQMAATLASHVLVVIFVEA